MRIDCTRRSIVRRNVRRGVACILAASLCLAGIYVSGDGEGAGSMALASSLTSMDGVWEYDITSSMEAIITGYNGEDTKLCIPETIYYGGGADLAVTEIAEFAFSECENLISVEIPGSVESIGEGILRGCSNIREITVSEENAYYDSREGCNAIIEKAADTLVAGCRSSRIPDDVKVIGNYAFVGCTALTDVTFPEGLTEIGKFAFSDCSGITRIEIPGSVESIGEGMLRGCSNIREITVSEENTHYDSREGCNAIIEKASDTLAAGCRSSRIPDDVKVIGNYAFAGCTALTDVTFPEGLTEIGNCAFSGCSGITRIEIPESVTAIYGNPFAGCSLQKIKVAEGNRYYNSGDNCNAIFESWDYSWGYGLLVGSSNTAIPEEGEDEYGKEISFYIAARAFSGCAGLESIYIPPTVNMIDSNAFEDCTNLRQVDFAEEGRLKSIHGYAFSGCTSLKSISLPSGITWVYEHVFDGCSSLERVQVPEGVDPFSSHAFDGCSSLREINYPESLKSIGSYAFSGCTSLTETAIPSGVTKIGQGAFNECTGLKEIAFAAPSGITEIGEEAFRGCTGLTEIAIPEGVAKLGNGIFYGCDNLTKVDFPEGITKIPEYTFYSCGKLTDVGIPATLTEIGRHAFENCENLTRLEIPEGVTELGDYMFYQISSLKEVRLPDSLERIGNGVFIGTSLESLRIPKNVSSIGQGLFDEQAIRIGITLSDGFASIRRITVDEENETYDSRDGCNAIIKTKTNTLLYGSNTTTKIPEGVNTIGKYAFSGCKDLESIEISSTVDDIEGHIFTKCDGLSRITVAEGNPIYSSREGCNAVFEGNKLVVGCKGTKIPDNVRSLEISAFSGCTALTEIQLPSGLTRISDFAFMYCKSLKSLRIPDGVTTIGYCAFNWCSSLEHVYIPSSVTRFDGAVFLGSSKMTIHTKEGADAVEYAEKHYIPYTFEPMPVETQSPQVTVAPQETLAPQETVVPKETAAPQETLTPQETVTPQETLKPVQPNIKKPGKPNIKKLQNKSGKKVTLTLSKKVAGASGYQVAYAVKPSMEGQKKKSFKGTSVTVTGLKKKKTYYFRVRAYVKENGETVYGSWGKKKKIKIEK